MNLRRNGAIWEELVEEKGGRNVVETTLIYEFLKR